MAWYLLPRNQSKMFPPPNLLKIGYSPTIRDFNNFLFLLCSKQRFKAVIYIFSQLSSNQINADTQTLKIFAKALLKENKYGGGVGFSKTLRVKSRIGNMNRVLDSSLQGVCSSNHDPDRGFSLLKSFLEIEGFFPSSRTFCLLIFGFSKLGKMDKVIDLLELMSDDKFNYPFDNFVCSSVIAGFSRIGEYELAVRFYDNAVKSGNLVPNVVTCTALLNVYCKLGEKVEAFDLVAWMEDNNLPFDVVFYSNWMYACLSEGLIHEALERFTSMADRKIELDNIGYTMLIDGFSKQGIVEKAVGFLYKMRREGVELNVVTYTAIILGFCKKGKLDEALAIFGMLKRLGMEPDEVTYAVLIDGACRTGDFSLVFQLLDEMVKKGVNPGVVTYNTVINGLCKVGRTMEADDFSKGIIGDAVTYTTLLHGYLQEQSSLGILETKRRVEESGVTMDIVMCNVLIKATLMIGLFDYAYAIYRGLTTMNLLANSVTYCTLVDGYCRVGMIDEALEVFEDFRKSLNVSAACYNCIISGLCKKGLVDMAIDVFIEYIGKGMPLDKTICKLLIKAMAENKGAEGILKMIYKLENVEHQSLCDICNDTIFFLSKMEFVFPEDLWCGILSQMRRKGLELSSMCFYSMLRKLLSEGKTPLVRSVLPLFVKSHGMFDVGVCKILVHYLCFLDVKKALVYLSTLNGNEWSITIPIMIFMTLTNNGRVLDAYELLVGAENHLPNMDVFNYSIMVDALCKGKHIDKALNVCSVAKGKGIALNIVTYNSVINGLCHQGCLIEAFRLYDSLERINVCPTEVTYGTLIDALVREGLLHDARMLFDIMLAKDLTPGTHIYNSLINGYCRVGRLEEGMKLFHDLEVRVLKPDGFTVAALINGYCQKGDMEGALKLYFEFKLKGLLPDFHGIMHLVRGLCAKGRMEESRSVLKEMLQTQSFVEILRRVDLEIKLDSVGNMLMFLCQQGRMDEAIAVLNEVESILFFTGRSCSTHVPDSEAGIDPLPFSDSQRNQLRTSGGEDGKVELLKDFDSFYSVIRSLCLKGNSIEVKRLMKMLMTS
ncbi:pentatricopeptide repeat-containing protein At5g57250, mitochondrial [Andrographis paniculata]|uniref:pentatricopeptide repeat-containing protein At5g57250, mitochondrial n=1 Tax=Andrographis paniculata TaxID=175694 RepID=UPI0021E7508A|nr:pentatricopeptide repeat-containing protein At5g57250, mitochondrial [Andrographis paniculata]